MVAQHPVILVQGDVGHGEVPPAGPQADAGLEPVGAHGGDVESEMPEIQAGAAQVGGG